MQESRVSKWVGVGLIAMLIVGGLIGLGLTPSSKLLAAGNTIEIKGGSHVTFNAMPQDDHVVIDGKSTVTFDGNTKPRSVARASYGNIQQVAYEKPKPTRPARGTVVHNYYAPVTQYHDVSPDDLPEGRAGRRQMAQWNREFGQ